MKPIALYLPQFHRIPENDSWWGEGFTEWVNVKKARPLFEGHRQPRVPLGGDYYDLSDVEVMRRQSALARQYGIYGFCFYHYWFDGKLLLEKPVEHYLKTRDIDFHYCISWANEHWTNQWVSDKMNVLMEQKYGDQAEWRAHFEYLLPFFKDCRYIKNHGKPIFLIYRPELIDRRREMFDYWNRLAAEEGFPGICFVFQRGEILLNDKNADLSMFDYGAVYQPGLTQAKIQRGEQRFQSLRNLKRTLGFWAEKHLKIDSRSISLLPHKSGIRFDDYDEVWNRILTDEDLFPHMIPSAFVDWDNTPRKGERGSVIRGASPEKFENYFKQLIRKAKSSYETDLVFIFAWNEWAEGGILEPDEYYGDGYLEAVRHALMETDEFETEC